MMTNILTLNCNNSGCNNPRFGNSFKCKSCYYEREFEKKKRYADKIRNKPKVYTTIKTYKPLKSNPDYRIPKISKKTQVKNNKYLTALSKRKQLVQKCEGCGQVGSDQCDGSHYIFGRSEEHILEFSLHCRKCHEKWESSDIIQMMELHDFEKRILRIYEIRKDIFYSLMGKLDTVDSDYYDYIMQKVKNVQGNNCGK